MDYLRFARILLGPGLFVLWQVLLLSAPATASPATESVPLAVERVLQGYDLRSRWRFGIGDDPAWAAPRFDDSSWQVRSIPERWPAGGYPASSQFAWYRKTIQLSPTAAAQPDLLSRVGIKLGEIPSAYQLYAGGILLGGRGRFPPAADANFDQHGVYALPPSAVASDGSLVLALRVWGGEGAVLNHWEFGPKGREFKLGSYAQLLQQDLLQQMPFLIACALCLSFGLYHLYLFTRNRHLQSLLWFGCMGVNVAVYGFMLTQAKFLLGWSHLVYEKIELGSIYIMPALSIQMVWVLLQAPISPRLRWYQASFIFLGVLVVLMPGLELAIVSLQYWQLWTLPALGLISVLLWRKLAEANGEARTLFPGAMVFVAAALHDIIRGLVGAEFERLLPYGFVAIMLSMAVSLANRFTTLLHTLEIEVAERTQELSEANQHLSAIAKMDPMTQLYNRRGFTEETEAEIQRMFRSGRGFSLVLADIDHFKSINDRYGHACGDHVLKRVAAILRDRLRDVDRVGRWGGEEFILLLPETDSDGAAVLADKLREAVADNIFEFELVRLSVTMTFGVASYRKGERLETCIARADTALYHGKDQGRNKVMIGSYKGLTLVR